MSTPAERAAREYVEKYGYSPGQSKTFLAGIAWLLRHAKENRVFLQIVAGDPGSEYVTISDLESVNKDDGK